MGVGGEEGASDVERERTVGETCSLSGLSKMGPDLAAPITLDNSRHGAAVGNPGGGEATTPPDSNMGGRDHGQDVTDQASVLHKTRFGTFLIRNYVKSTR
jgi:hypothetical protein